MALTVSTNHSQHLSRKFLFPACFWEWDSERSTKRPTHGETSTNDVNTLTYT